MWADATRDDSRTDTTTTAMISREEKDAEYNYRAVRQVGHSSKNRLYSIIYILSETYTLRECSTAIACRAVNSAKNNSKVEVFEMILFVRYHSVRFLRPYNIKLRTF